MKEMVRRFDEVLSDKASKSQITQMEYDIEQSYVKKKYWDRLQTEISETMQQQQGTVKHMQESFKHYETNMSGEIDLAVKKGLCKYMTNYEKVLKQFERFFD
jgi:gas vesicle protein